MRQSIQTTIDPSIAGDEEPKGGETMRPSARIGKTRPVGRSTP